MAQNHVSERTCGFESRSGYFAVMPQWYRTGPENRRSAEADWGFESLSQRLDRQICKSESRRTVNPWPSGVAGSSPALPTICPSSGPRDALKTIGRADSLILACSALAVAFEIP